MISKEKLKIKTYFQHSVSWSVVFPLFIFFRFLDLKFSLIKAQFYCALSNKKKQNYPHMLLHFQLLPKQVKTIPWLEKKTLPRKSCRQQRVITTIEQGSHPFLETNFNNFSSSFPELKLILPGNFTFNPFNPN